MSNVLEEMKTRRSIRKFKPDAIPQEILDKIIEAGTYAANGRGAQNVIIIQVTDKEKRDEIAKKNAEIMGSEGDPFYGAPAMLIVLGKKDWPTHVYDGSLVMGNLTPEAVGCVTAGAQPITSPAAAAGFTARKRNLKAAGAGNCLHPLGLRMNMRESDTVRSAMWTGIIRMLFQEKKTAYSISDRAELP